MRNFIFDVWVWSKAKHSRLLKQIRVKALSFPSDMFCLNEAAKDADISPYMKSDEFEVTTELRTIDALLSNSSMITYRRGGYC